MTAAGRVAALAEEFRPILAAYFRGPVPEDLVLELAGTLSGVIAREAEKTCRPYPWPPPRRHRLDEAKAQQQERRTA